MNKIKEGNMKHPGQQDDQLEKKWSEVKNKLNRSEEMAADKS